MMGHVEAQELQWYAVRVKARPNGGSRTTVVNAEIESYIGRGGKKLKRKIKDTGTREFVPELILKRAGFEVFLPIKKVWRTKNRFTHEQQLVSYPMLVDWMFVGWPVAACRWHELMAFDVVAGVMGTGGRPVRVPSARVMEMMRRWGGGKQASKLQRDMRPDRAYAVGDLVHVVDGPFYEFNAKVLEIKGSTVRAVVHIFGRETPVEFQPHELAGDRPDVFDDQMNSEEIS